MCAEKNAESLIIVSGVSGSGKSTALNALEDLGFYCVDNLPPFLVESFVDSLRNGVLPGESRRFAVLLNCAQGNTASSLLSAFQSLRESGVRVDHLFLDSQNEVLLRRYQQTRRSHPLLGNRSAERSIAEAITEERHLLTELRAAATKIIDTSYLSPHTLRKLVAEYVGEQFEFEITLLSFGFKYGAPTDADLLLDVRFLPNPYFVPELHERNGTDTGVQDYVFRNGDAASLVEQYSSLLTFLLPRYKEEGKRYLNVGIGCTGGKHRSIAVTLRLAEALKPLGMKILVKHRDRER